MPNNVNGSLKFIVAMLVLALICMAAVGGVLVYAPPDQKLTLITLILGFLTATTTLLFNSMGQYELKRKVDEVKVKADDTHALTESTASAVDGQMTSFKEALSAMAQVNERLARLEGEKTGQEAGKAAEHASGLAVSEAMQKGIALALPLVRAPKE